MLLHVVHWFHVKCNSPQRRAIIGTRTGLLLSRCCHYRNHHYRNLPTGYGNDYGVMAMTCWFNATSLLMWLTDDRNKSVAGVSGRHGAIISLIIAPCWPPLSTYQKIICANSAVKHRVSTLVRLGSKRLCTRVLSTPPVLVIVASRRWNVHHFVQFLTMKTVT